MKTIQLSTGQKLVDFTPEDNQPKGIVHIATIKRLANLLAVSVNISMVKDQICRRIKDQESLEEIVTVMEEESAFHRTVNLIREYNADKPEPSIETNETMSVERT